MSIVEPGWIKRLVERRRLRRWRADSEATVRWAVTSLTLVKKATCASPDRRTPLTPPS